MNNKLIISGETVYPCEHPKGVIHAAYEADWAGYQFLVHGGKIYAIVRFGSDRNDSLYLCECETDQETTAEIVADFERVNGVKEHNG